MDPLEPARPPHISRRTKTPRKKPPGALRLAILFGLFYFIQGIAEPTEGLIAQPTNSLLKSWGQTTAEMGLFVFLVGLPWSCKPLYGVISDFIPLWGLHRKSYLLLTSALTAGALLILWQAPLPVGAVWWLFWLLLPACLGVAFSDVVVDALMVERGQPLGMTGTLQSVQWTAIWLSTILTGSLGGWLSQSDRQQTGFLICGLMAIGTFAVSLTIVEPRQRRNPGGVRAALGQLTRSASSRHIVVAGLFMFLWNFNPFSTTVLYWHMTKDLAFSEQFYGNSRSWYAIGSMLGSLVYGFYCRKVPLGLLVHLSIVAGIGSTLCYLLMHDERTALTAALISGVAYATGTMVQLDLAARRCPPEAAGTLFALLMALSNFGTSLSTWFGGALRDLWAKQWSPDIAFQMLVVVGAAFTAGCWLLVPWLRVGRDEMESQSEV